MLLRLFFFTASLVFAQTDGEAVRLLSIVADAAAHSSSWQVDGTVEYPGDPDNQQTEPIKLLFAAPGRSRYEQGGVSSPALIVCDGATAWIYSPALHRYRKELASGNRLCIPILGAWRSLVADVQSPSVIGTCDANPSSETGSYSLVRGYSTPEYAQSGRITRTLCIDGDNRWIVWERWQNQYTTRLYRYRAVSHPTETDETAFAFVPEQGSSLTEYELPAPRALGENGMSATPEITRPKLVRNKPPNYPESARRARIEGTVHLYVVIGLAGDASEILVYRSVSPALDAEAVKTVRQWRFTQGERNGQPTALPVMIEVNFRLSSSGQK